MSWYSSPIQPIDPVAVSQTPKPPFRYIRDNFAGTGQHSYVQAPAQDQSQWQALTNVQPITQGILNQRWGYVPFAQLVDATSTRLANFQSDSNGVRSILTTGLTNVAAFNENGTSYNNNVFTPVMATGAIRSTTSRNFQYFCDGNNALIPATHRTGDSLKWNGAASGGTTNNGILVNDVTKSTTGSTGPNTGTTAIDSTLPGFPANPWTNPSGIFTNNIGSAASVRLYIQAGGAIFTESDLLKAEGFFSSVQGTNVVGVQVSIQYQVSIFGGTVTTPSVEGSISLLKNGSPVGTSRFLPLAIDGATHTLTFGGPNDLFGAALTINDLIQNTFGFQMAFTGGGGFNSNVTSGFNLLVPFVTMLVTTSSSTGGNVVQTTTIPGGNINLTLGRIYYLVANTSTVGHFSDLNTPSTTTGPVTNSEFNLSLPVYNDPQVDFKYVLATADGGDPSILYETSVLVPGLTVSSWAINGANQVTFTGVYTGPQPANGTQFTVGGLSHGSYMNGTVVTVTGSTPTTLVANFTHGADSATEVGVVGNFAFAIPNSVTLVVDNTPDPTLVLNQPLLFTDTFGNEFGVAGNTPPPAGNLIIKHQGRLWMAGVPGSTHSVFFSKSTAELTLPNGFVAGKYEEAWPGSNYFDVSDGAESVTAMLSDGTTLYLGTQNHVRRLLGNAPVNFQEPQIVHPEVGVINQEVWQLTFMQGAPSGSCWMTPDFRVIQSDFNTYVDIGTPIQDILNNLQPGAQSLAHAAYVSDGEFELYILAVPFAQPLYCDLHLVYDLRSRQWFVWQPHSGSLSILYNITQAGVPQWIFLPPTITNSPSFVGALTSITRSGGVVQGFLNPTSLPFGVGSVVVISGVADSSFNGSFTVTAIGQVHFGGQVIATTVSWSQGGPNAGSTGGTLSFTPVNGALNIYSSASTTDNGFAIPVTATTTWLHLGEPTRRKMLNEIQVYGNTGMTMTVNGSNNLADFTSTPRSIIYNRLLRQSPFGTWNLYLTGAKTRHRYYQFTFSSSNGKVPLLGSYAISVTPLDDL